MKAYRPRAFYERHVAHNGTHEELREAHLDLTTEHERLREWIRDQGLIPPVFSMPEQKVDDICDEPITHWQCELKLKVEE